MGDRQSLPAGGGHRDASIGILRLLCLKFRDQFWLATIIGAGLFLFSAGVGHLYQFIAFGDSSPNNIGGVLWVDLLYPILLGALYLLYRRGKANVQILQ